MRNGNSSFVGKTLLLVNAGSIKKRFILKQLKKMGLVVVCLDKEKSWANNYVDYWISSDNTNHQEAMQSLKEFLNNNPHVKIDGVLTFWEDDVLLCSKIVDRFNFIGTPFSVAKKIRNKFIFREFCQENGIPSPRHQLLKSPDDIKKMGPTARFPMVIKPVFGASSAYVVKVDSQEELLSTYDYLKRNMKVETESALNEGLEIFVEDYIEGDEVDIDIIIQNGKIKFYSVTDNYQTKEPFFVETGQSIPSSLSGQRKDELIDMAEEALEKLGVQNGVIHFEAKSTKNGAVPIEINLRMGGDEVYSFVKEAWRVDLIESAVKIAIGEHISKIKRPDIPYKYITGVYFLPEYSGVLLKLNINKELYKKPYLEELHIFKKIGDPILTPPEGYEFLGWMTVSGHSLPTAQENLKDAIRYVDFEVARFTPESSIGKTSRKNSFSQAELNADLLIRSAKIEKIRQMAKDDLKSLHIGIACNLYSDDIESHSVEKELMTVGKNIENTLKALGYKVTFFDFANIAKVFNKLKSSDVDVVFNVCERINNSSLLEPHAAALMDILQVPYTGSNPSTLALCIDKIRVKKLLTYHNIPTPKWDYVYTMEDEIDESLRYPQIIKPANTDNSIGITNESVVRNDEERKKQLEKVIVGMGSPALIEEYIEGDEYDVSIIGNDDDLRVLPLSRSIFKNMPEGSWHIYTHEMKFGEKPVADFGVTVQRPAKNISKKLEALLSELGLDTYNILDCHDYGRVEIRVDENDNPYVLELNPNPSINIGDCVPEMANLMQMNYSDFLEEIIKMAIKRYQDAQPYQHLITNII